MLPSAEQMKKAARRNNARQSKVRQMRMDKLRGVAHTKTRKEWREELRIGASTLDTYLAELGEKAKPANPQDVHRARASTHTQRIEKAKRLEWIQENAHKYTRSEIARHFKCAGFTVDRYLAELNLSAREAADPALSYEMMREWLRKPIMCPRKAKQLAEAYEAEGLV